MVLRKFFNNATGGLLTAFANNNNSEEIQQLEAMGFPRERAIHALNATDNDVERAAELLLLGVNESDYPTSTAAATNNNNNSNANEGTHVAAHNEELMRLAIEESLQVNQRQEANNLRRAEIASLQNNNNRNKARIVSKKPPAASTEVIDLTGDDDDSKPAATTTTTKRNTTPVKSAASVNAGKAAVSRLTTNTTKKNTSSPITSTTLSQTHPNVKLPTKLQSKSKEEQILRTANRVKPHVMAVDTLLRVLLSVRSSPDNIKFRVIDRTNANYVQYVRDVPGAEDLLLAMNYRRNDYVTSGKNELRLERHLVDDALLYLGISALEQMRESEEYKMGKKLRAFHGDMRRIGKGQQQQQNLTESEMDVRLQYLTKCPKEPPVGRGALMNVHLGDEREKIDGGLASRRFDSDDTLADVLNWLGGCYGDELLEKLRSREWCLCDLNRYPILPLDVEKHQNKTLQYLGLFPSGKLGVRLSEDSWRDGDEMMDDIHGSARGLGAASRSMLH
jgi:hypothetical protein